MSACVGACVPGDLLAVAPYNFRPGSMLAGLLDAHMESRTVFKICLFVFRMVYRAPMIAHTCAHVLNLIWMSVYLSCSQGFSLQGQDGLHASQGSAELRDFHVHSACC